MTSKISYIDYHIKSYEIGDIDPAYPMLKYICDRFELNIEQRFWIAFLYGCCYCGPTVFYMYNEFPDFENVNLNRLQHWWDCSKNKCLFQTDRLRIKSNDQFVPAFESYRYFIGEYQNILYTYCSSLNRKHNYYVLYKSLKDNIKYFGRYSMFLWLECMHQLTNINILPDRLDWKYAENCMNGLLLSTGINESKYSIDIHNMLDRLLDDTIRSIKHKYPAYRTDIWNVETTLCAYKKYRHGKRYIGYYIKRQKEEIDKMSDNVKTGVCWDVLYDFRKEHFKPEILKQFS